MKTAFFFFCGANIASFRTGMRIEESEKTISSAPL
jgi:hypothetical protein